MGLSADNYRRGLQALLPTGAAWPREADRTFTRFLAALADEFARVDARAGILIEEIDPRITSELLPDWEQAFGLPDQCSAQSETLTARRAALLARMTTTGGQSAQYFIDLSAALGFTVSVSEFRQFRVGQSAVGDALYGDDWVYAWQVNAPLDTIQEFRVNQNAVGDPLRSWGNTSLECVISARKPAQSFVIFSYA